LEGFLDAIQEKVSATVRLGVPRQIPNLPPALKDTAYSDVIGALDYSSYVPDPHSYSAPVPSAFGRWVDSAKRWVSDYF